MFKKPVACYISTLVSKNYLSFLCCDYIFLYGNIGIIYGESPVESITWQDIEGRPYTPIRQDWPQLMAEHFVPWEDGRKTWIELENIGK